MKLPIPKPNQVVWISALAGLLFGLLLISPFAMIVSDLAHPMHATDASVSPQVGQALRDALGPRLWWWKIAHALVGLIFGLAIGVGFSVVLRGYEKIHQLKDERRHNEMTLEIGKLVSGIVHNINNYLTVLNGNAELLKTRFPGDEDVAAVLQSGRDLRAMAQNILTHAGLQQSPLEEIDLNATLKRNVEFLKGNLFFKNNVTVRMDLDPLLPRFSGHESDFLESTYNLMDNAVDAMTRSERKELTLRTRYEGSHLRVDIVDSGHGIPKDVMQKLFRAGFTTKPFEAAKDEPTGTGFGLANVKDLMRAYEVKIDVASRPGETRFTLFIPHKKRAVPAAA